MAHDPNSGMTLLALDGGLVHHVSTGPEKQYVARDAAWQAYFTEHDLRNRGHNSMVVAGMHDAFNAGWAARKKAELEMAFGLDKPKAE